MSDTIARVLDALAGWLKGLLGVDTPELVPVPIPVEQPRRR